MSGKLSAKTFIMASLCWIIVNNYSIHILGPAPSVHCMCVHFLTMIHIKMTDYLVEGWGLTTETFSMWQMPATMNGGRFVLLKIAVHGEQFTALITFRPENCYRMVKKQVWGLFLRNKDGNVKWKWRTELWGLGVMGGLLLVLIGKLSIWYFRYH